MGGFSFGGWGKGWGAAPSGLQYWTHQPPRHYVARMALRPIV
jgi:hypothetical protein